MSKKKKNKKDVSNKYEIWATNPTVQPDETTEMNVPIPSEQNVQNSKEYGENHEM
ncbi:MAG: DUF3787 domain-containing protein [Eubacterium sp.]|nr:DUF3787 domain-containing protein [Eubacterium sp.]